MSKILYQFTDSLPNWTEEDLNGMMQACSNELARRKRELAAPRETNVDVLRSQATLRRLSIMQLEAEHLERMDDLEVVGALRGLARRQACICTILLKLIEG